MTWLTRLLNWCLGRGPRVDAEVKEAADTTAQAEAEAEALVQLAWRLVKQFALTEVGAVVETWERRAPDEVAANIVARVTFTHDGVVFRLYVLDWDTCCELWLETRSKGTYGNFTLCRVDKGETFADGELRFFLNEDCYVTGPRVRNEVARIWTLPPDVQQRLIALARRFDRVALEDEVMSVHLGGLSSFSGLVTGKKRARQRI